jgi:hypothetical protein
MAHNLFQLLRRELGLNRHDGDSLAHWFDYTKLHASKGDDRKYNGRGIEGQGNAFF